MAKTSSGASTGRPGPRTKGGGAEPRETGAGDRGFRSGFVAIAGRPNVGKSTLLNRLLAEKLSIVSDKPQTTRNAIRGILTREDAQVIFIDTPGVHRARDEINRYMVRAAQSTFGEVDRVLFLVEPSPGVGPGDRALYRALEAVETPASLVVNKIDTLSEAEREAARDRFAGAFPGLEVYTVSALTGEGVEGLLEGVVSGLPEGPLLYPPDQIAVEPVRFLCAEIVREKVFELTAQEVPYAAAVEITSFKESPESETGLVTIDATIHVERQSQKGILIGKGGGMLKRIGTQARMDIEALLGAKVFLRLWVKVSKDWRNDPKRLRWLGYRS